MTGLVIFDLDGTLVDTCRMTVQAFRELTGRYGLPMPAPEAIRNAMGLHDSLFYRAIFPDAVDARFEGFSREVDRREIEIGRQLGSRVLFPGVAGMLERLQARGATLCLASTAGPEHVHELLRSAGIHERFREIRCDAPDKSAMTADILRRYGPADAAFVGDTRIDVQAALSNDIRIYGAGFGYVKARERTLFDAVAESPEALERLLCPFQ